MHHFHYSLGCINSGNECMFLKQWYGQVLKLYIYIYSFALVVANRSAVLGSVGRFLVFLSLFMTVSADKK